MTAEVLDPAGPDGAIRTAVRTCPLCEATCGLTITLTGDTVLQVRGNPDHVFSHGFICPKGVALAQLHEDPDRLTAPLVRRDGSLVPVTWAEAFARVAELLAPVVAAGDSDAIAVYLGNPNVHNLSSIYLPALLQALNRPQRYSASTVDQWPKQLASGLMFGTMLSVAVADIDRTDYLLVLGADPMVSNGSLLTAPDMPGRLRALRARGGRLVVVDPRRSRTAAVADEHVPVVPGTDALLLASMAQVIVTEGLVDLGSAAPWIQGSDDVASGVGRFSPERVAPVTGVPADTIRRLARELAAAPTAAVYGRIGTTTTSFGTTASWLIDVLNTLTGNLDAPGGVMWSRPATGSANTSGTPGRGRGVGITGSRHTRVRRAPSVMGEMPVAALAEEIDTPDDDGRHTRVLITIAGNPALSTPNSARLGAALPTLDALICVDAYLNETSSQADVVLPAASPLAHGHYDLVFSGLAVRNVATWSPAVVAMADTSLGEPMLDEWEVLLSLAAAAGSWPGELADWDGLVASLAVAAAVADPSSPLAGAEAAEVLDSLSPRTGPERIVDLLLRSGPYGLTLADLEREPNGIDLGALQPRLPEVLRTPSGMVELAPVELIADLDRLDADLARREAMSSPLVLIGRRDLRSNNSWMHNLPLLVKGRDRCTLHVHPEDAVQLGLTDGDDAIVASRVGEIVVPVELSDTIMRGVVSLPHGWGHARQSGLSVASEHPGVNTNLLTDEQETDPLSGNAVLNAIPVTVSAIPVTVSAP